MQLCATALHKHVEEGQRAAIRLLVTVTLPVQHTHSLTDFLLLINCKQVRHLETKVNRLVCFWVLALLNGTHLHRFISIQLIHLRISLYMLSIPRLTHQCRTPPQYTLPHQC